MQRRALRAVAVRAAEHRAHLRAALLEQPGGGEARRVLLEGGGEADQVRRVGGDLLDQSGDEHGGERAGGPGEGHLLLARAVGGQVLEVPLGVGGFGEARGGLVLAVQRAGEGPVAGALEVGLLGEVLVVVHAESGGLGRPVHEVQVGVAHFDLVAGAGGGGVQDPERQRRHVDRTPGHVQQDDTHDGHFCRARAVDSGGGK